MHVCIRIKGLKNLGDSKNTCIYVCIISMYVDIMYVYGCTVCMYKSKRTEKLGDLKNIRLCTYGCMYVGTDVLGYKCVYMYVHVCMCMYVYV